MEPDKRHLRVIGGVSSAAGSNQAIGSFHLISRVIPTNQELLIFPSSMIVRDALTRMAEHDYSQVPVIGRDGYVRGAFSYRSFALAASSATLKEVKSQDCMPGDLPVEEFVEIFQYARTTQELREVLEIVQRDGGILIGTPDRLKAILTSTDIVQYLEREARPFIMVSEIERTLRELIRSAFTDGELIECALRTLKSAYEKQGRSIPPTKLHEMTFNDYIPLICNEENWPRFEDVLGGFRPRVRSKLEEVRDLRNVLSHFKRDTTREDREKIRQHRDWLLQQVRELEGKMKVGERS